MAVSEPLADSMLDLRFALHTRGAAASAAWRPGRALEVVDERLARLPFDPPDSLRAWLTLQDGCHEGFEQPVFGFYIPLGLDAALADYDFWMTELNQPDWEFRKPTLFPLLVAHGCHLAMDCGDGPNRGHVLYADREDLPRPEFDRLEDLLSAALECFDLDVYEVTEEDDLEEDYERARTVWARHKPGRNQVQQAAIRAGAIDWSDDDAVEALRGLGEEVSRAALTAVEEGLARGEIPHAALQVVCDAPPDGALELLIRMLEVPDWDLQLSAIRGLSRLHAPEATPALLALFERGSNYAAEREPFLRQVLSPEQLSRSAGENDLVRNAIVHYFRTEQDPRVMSVAQRALQSQERELRAGGAMLLGYQNADAAVPQLIRALVDPEPPVVYAAAEALGEIGDPAAAPALIEAFEAWLDTTREQIERMVGIGAFSATGPSMAAAHALTKLDAPKAGPLLQSLLDDLWPDDASAPYERRATALHFAGEFVPLLARWGHTMSPDRLVAWLDLALELRPQSNYGAYVVPAADGVLSVLANVLGAAAEESAREWLRDAEPHFARGALAEIGKGRAPWATKLLQEYLLNPSPVARDAAARALGGGDAATALPGLVLALEDEHPIVRWRACRAVERLAAADGAAALAAATEDPDEAVAAAALEALWTLDRPVAERCGAQPARALVSRIRDALAGPQMS